MSKQNKVAVNLAQDFTDAEKAQARANIGAGTGDSNIMFSNVLGGADNSLANMQISIGRQTVPSTLSYYNMSVTNEYSNTKTFALIPTDKDDGMVVLSNGHVMTQPILTSAVTNITSYSASFGNSWTTMRQINSSISSGSTIKDITLSTPITLSAGKKYLIIPRGIIGNVEQTKTSSATSNVAYSIRIWLIDSNVSVNNGRTAGIIGEAEIANHYVSSIGQYPPVDGVYRGSFAPTAAIIEPTQDLSLDTLRISNSGNIDFGYSTSNPATLVMDHRITGIVVMEIQ